MPPRAPLQSSFSVSDVKEEVACPLTNQDGSQCRKRCIGEKRFRSIQEHIRRAHPEHYVPKLPATEESFNVMIHMIPSENPHYEGSPASQARSFNDRRGGLFDDISTNPGTPRFLDDFQSMQGAAHAAEALAELNGMSSDRGSVEGDHYSLESNGRHPLNSIELPPLNVATGDVTSDPFSNSHSNRRDLLPSILNHSPPGRSSTLPPLHKPLGPNRSRKSSVTKRSQQHRKKNSRGNQSDWLRRIQNEDGRPHSAEPSADYSRFHDLVAVASMAGDLDEERTPMPQSPISQASLPRGSLPPLMNQAQLQQNSYQASPLQQALTPPSNIQDIPEPFPSIESNESNDHYHVSPQGLSDTSPSYDSQNVQIYCGACRSLSRLRSSYACTECICGFCQTCVEVLMQEQGARRKCPRCATIGGRFKPFQLDIK